MAISVKSLSVSRGGINLLEGLDIELNSGQAGILRGPNGVGKTTLLLSPCLPGVLIHRPLRFELSSVGLLPRLRIHLYSSILE